MTTFNRDQLSDWLHDFLPEEMRELDLLLDQKQFKN